MISNSLEVAAWMLLMLSLTFLVLTKWGIETATSSEEEIKLMRTGVWTWYKIALLIHFAAYMVR